MDLTVVGHLSRDLVITPTFRREVLGGGPAYAMLGPAVGTSGTAVVTKVGLDFEEEYTRALRSSGLDLSGMTIEGPHTTRFVNEYDASGRRLQRLEAVAPPVRPTDLTDRHLSASCVHFCPITAHEVSVTCLRRARRSGALVSLDVQGFVRTAHGRSVVYGQWPHREEYLPLVDVVKADEDELLLSTGCGSESGAVEYLLSLGPSIIVVTRERRGSTLFTADERLDIPAVPPRRVVDATGCGDTYMVGLLVEYSMTHDLWRAALFGATCASFNLETVGPYVVPSRDDVEQRMAPYL